MPEKVRTIRDNLKECVDVYLYPDCFVSILHKCAQDELAQFNTLSFQQYTYRGNEQLSAIKSGNMGAQFQSKDEGVNCYIAFALCNPTDSWDEEICHDMVTARMASWQDFAHAYIGQGGQKIPEIHPATKLVCIPHHIARPLYEFVVRIKSLLGSNARFPKWVYDFLHQYEAELQGKEDARISERKERIEQKRIKKNLKALEVV